jgi:peptidyl-prolyl cis-trans isomerase D
MLRILRSGQRWLTAFLIAGIGTVFVVFLGLQGGPSKFASTSADTIVKVGRYEFGIADFERVRERRERAIQAELGDKYEPRALRETLDRMTVNDLVQSALLAIAAEDLGIHVGTREIEQLALADPGFRDEQGRFDPKIFDAYVREVYGGQRAYMAERRVALLTVKMLGLLQSQPEVSAGEAREAAKSGLEEVKIAFALIDASHGDAPEIAPEAVADAVAKRGDEIAKLYQEKGDVYNRPERVHARHILRTLPPNAPAADVDRVRGEIEAAAKRIEGGEPFEQVAAEISQDPGSKARGGDLGFFARGQMVKPFEDAAFALAPGQTSGPVKTDFGFHLIKVEERQEALTRPLESVREEIATDLLRREALRERARERADKLAEAVRGGKSLEDAAREQQVNLGRSGWLARGKGFVPGLGTAPELLATAFVLEPGKSSPRIFEVGDTFALVQLVERKDADPAAVDALVEKKREELLDAKREARIGAWMEARRTALEKSGDFQVNLKAIRG